MDKNTATLQPMHHNDREELVNQATAEASQGIFRIDTSITEKTASWLSGNLNYRVVKHPGSPIFLIINTPGGHITDGMAIYDTIEGAKTNGCDVYTIGTGLAASMGAFLLAAGSKGKRYATPSCSILLHQPLGGVSGQATDMLIHVENIIKMKKGLLEHFSKFTGQSTGMLEPKMERDYIIDAKQALREGIVDFVDYEINVLQKGWLQ